MKVITINPTAQVYNQVLWTCNKCRVVGSINYNYDRKVGIVCKRCFLSLKLKEV